MIPATRMVEIGRELAQARARTGLSLETLSRRTKVSIPVLEAIERGQIGCLPGGIYTRGLLRAYAREVGCDAEDIVRRFRASCEDDRLDESGTLQQITAAADRAKTLPAQAPDTAVADRRRVRRQLIFLALALAGGGMMYGAYGSYGAYLRAIRLHAEHTQPLAIAPAAAPPQMQGELATSGVEAPSGDHAESRPVTLRLEFESRGPCWLSGTADGARVLYQLFESGGHAQIEAHDEVVLRVGDPAALELTINGMATKPLGAASEAVTIHLTPQNYRAFLTE